ncbi:MAG: hypothetical protein AAGA91_07295 [Pseudomonadota bacterium]
MKRIVIVWLLAPLLSIAPVSTLACANHLYFNPDELGFLGAAVVRLAGLAPPEPVFELKHPAMAKSSIGEQSEVMVSYARPFFSKDVRLEVSGTRNVSLDVDVVPLIDREGVVTIPYEVTGTGFDTITLTVVGQHKGKTVRQVGRMYVSAKPAQKEPAQEMQVSGR